MATRSTVFHPRPARAVLVRALLTCLLCLALTLPAFAQAFDQRFPFAQRQHSPQSGPFFPFFPSFRRDPAPRRHRAPVDHSHAPPAAQRKDGTEPVATIVVLGDSMADWLAYGLERILSERPEIGVVRKHHTRSGLIHYDAKDKTQDWATVARRDLAGEKANAVVMMIGLHDRRSIRVSEPPAEEKKPKANPDQPSIAARERKHARARETHEFKSEKWVELYTKRIDETLAALKSRAVPVFWVGLPPVRGTRSTADMAFLNDLYRSRAEKAGVTYVDVWDGFINEHGKYVVYGPDFEGQRRRLRAGDGVHFTKAGALKLAHYVEREIRRVMGNRLVPVALPAQDEPTPQAAVGPGQPAPRPLVGPVVPLTAVPAGSNELLGGNQLLPPRADPIASRVLVKGEVAPPATGRADDFTWPRPAANVAAEPPAADAAASNAATAPTQAPTAQPAATPPAKAKKPTANAAPRRAKKGHAVARRNGATVAGQPVLRPPAPIP